MGEGVWRRPHATALQVKALAPARSRFPQHFRHFMAKASIARRIGADKQPAWPLNLRDQVREGARRPMMGRGKSLILLSNPAA